MFTVDYGDEEAKMKLTSLFYLVYPSKFYLSSATESTLVGCQNLLVSGWLCICFAGELNIPDDIPADWIICKFGRTIELIRCAKEHRRSFKRSIDVCLDKYTGFEDVNEIIKDFPEVRLSSMLI